MANRADYIDVSDAYFAAIEASDAAYEIYDTATKEFRANGDYTAFATAQAAYADARKAFDAAYDAELIRAREADVATAPGEVEQMEMFA